MNRSTIDPRRLARLRTICLSFEGAVEKVAWGDPTWRVRDAIFAMQKGNFEGGRPSVWLKAPDGAQAQLVASYPDDFFVPPYVGSKGWVGVYLDRRRVDWGGLTELLRMAHALIASRASKRGPARVSPRTRAVARPSRSSRRRT